MPEITADEARTIAIEVASLAMARTTEPTARGLSMRARRDLASIVYDVIAQASTASTCADGHGSAGSGCPPYTS